MQSIELPANPPTVLSANNLGFLFPGQSEGTNWLHELKTLAATPEIATWVNQIIEQSNQQLHPIQSALAALQKHPFEPLNWPEISYTDQYAPLAIPGLHLTQLALIHRLASQGADPKNGSCIGHSQGELAVIAAQAGAALDPQAAANALSIAQLVGFVAQSEANSVDLANTKHPVMLAVSGLTATELLAEISELNLVIAAQNTPTSITVTGQSSDVAELTVSLMKLKATRDAANASKTSIKTLPIRFQELSLSVAFHHPQLAPAVAEFEKLADLVDLDYEKYLPAVTNILTQPINWPQMVTKFTEPDFILNVGPSNNLTNLTEIFSLSNGIPVLNLDQGRLPIELPKNPAPWQHYLPQNIAGKVYTKFTELTGKPPYLLAGMTPTTVEPEIVAAAANAGYWAELAGGGQVTQDIFQQNITKLAALLNPGCTVQFNALFLDPYLWDLQLGKQKLVQQARRNGSPLDGVVISAGVPELDDAVSLIQELVAIGIPYIAFKPGTEKQIRQVLAIADLVPEVKLIIQIEGGAAGGHHSWESLPNLILHSYPEIRRRSNLVLAVGGGIYLPEIATSWLTGEWSQVYGYPAMPVDAVLLGTVAMATAEAKTSSQVKNALVVTGGTAVQNGSGTDTTAGVTSGLSQLGADIYFLKNQASECAAYLASLGGDTNRIAANKNKIIELLGNTAKPYFGDLTECTYATWLARYLDLILAPGLSELPNNWFTQLQEMVDRTVGRLVPQTQGMVTRFRLNADELPQSIESFLTEYPTAATAWVHPADQKWFIHRCAQPGKPVPFVPIIDDQVRKWWLSDSLWQSHQENFPAEQVLVIPSPVSVAGITRVNQPIAELLNEFQQHLVGTINTSTVLVENSFLDYPNVFWGDRLVQNPARLVASEVAETASATQVSMELAANLTLALNFNQSTTGIPVTSEIQSGLQAIWNHLGANKVQVSNGNARLQIQFNQNHFDSYRLATAIPTVAGVTAAQPLGLPDYLLGLSWPAVFAVLAQVKSPNGNCITDDVLDLVHLDHQISIAPNANITTELTVDAEAGELQQTISGWLIPAKISVRNETGLIAEFSERFLIKNRPGNADFPSLPTQEFRNCGQLTLAEFSLLTPASMVEFATVSGDLNPIHTSDAAAKLAGFSKPIVHGMWLSAVLQNYLPSIAPIKISKWQTQWLAPVAIASQVEISITRVGIKDGAEIWQIKGRQDSNSCFISLAEVWPTSVGYVFPGQGIQQKHMGRSSRERSSAAAAVWRRADQHTKTALGFSILTLVDENPVDIYADGSWHHHPDGVLHLTQFTQVAMAAMAVAQVAELKAEGLFVPDAIFAGHSVGEYTALAAITEVLELENLIEVVFHRGMAMHKLVPRDESGRSNYRLAAIRPQVVEIDDSEIINFITSFSEKTGEFLQVVNLNLAGAQYAIAGTIAGLELLEQEFIRLNKTKQRCFIIIPGIDVPFHSAVLAPGVADFRQKLSELLPAEIDPELLVGRYVPNLVAIPFELSTTFVSAMLAVTAAPEISEIAANWDQLSKTPKVLCRMLLTELLAWQFASPVRWIETQELFFQQAGLNLNKLIEIGSGAAPTLANLATQTLALPQHTNNTVTVLNIERDHLKVFALDETVEVFEESVTEPDPIDEPTPVSQVSTQENVPDLNFSAADAAKLLLAIWTKQELTKIPNETINSLVDGASSRRNQILMDLGAEFGIGAIDGAADASWAELSSSINKLVPKYHGFGKVLTPAIAAGLAKLGSNWGMTPSQIQDGLVTNLGLGDGWKKHLTAALLASSGSQDFQTAAESALALVCQIQQVPIPQVTVAPKTEVSSAALEEFSEKILGETGLLASTAKHLLAELGITAPLASPTTSSPPLALQGVEIDHDWQQQISPAFAAEKAVVFDDRWAGVRDDLARAYLDPGIRERNFIGLDAAARAHANWWLAKAKQEHRHELINFYGKLIDENNELPWQNEIALVTGIAPGSIAASIAAELLAGGATVVATASNLSSERLAFVQELYQQHAATGAVLWLVPANLASFSDIDELIAWLISPQYQAIAGVKHKLKDGLIPTLVFPFAAPKVNGTVAEVGPQTEAEARIMLWGVERLITGLANIGNIHAIVPGSPNRGIFGGDGGYGEIKAALDAFINKWQVEPNWANRVSLVDVQIGWVRGTGLMHQNDPLVAAVEAHGITTFSPTEMAKNILEYCTPNQVAAAKLQPLRIDLTGGLASGSINLAELAKNATSASLFTPNLTLSEQVPALTNPVAAKQQGLDWGTVTADLTDLVVIVGAAELGPCGSSRTRAELEFTGELSPAAVIELAWMCGLISWADSPTPGWQTPAGELLSEADIFEKFASEVKNNVGIREYYADGGINPDGHQLLTEVILTAATEFEVTSASEAEWLVAADPTKTSASETQAGNWLITKQKGAVIRVPKQVRLTRRVGAQIPANFDPKVWGLGNMAENIDRLAAWNLVATVDAFLSAGICPSELLQYLHPTMLANTQGTGIGGMQSTRRLYVDSLLGERVPTDVLQEALPNVIAAHVMQSYLGGYGAMIHPVAACATAAVSVAEGMAQIQLGKAEVCVAGGFDDLSLEGVLGFGSMNATAETDAMLIQGIEPAAFCRPNDRRRGGFVEGQGGGTVVLARGDIAAKLGLPVQAVVAYAQSFADGLHTSIPAPGLGAIAAGRGGAKSELVQQLAKLAVNPDEIMVISKHDTSTQANDPNESKLHEILATTIGRSANAPLFVVSQKSVTGHAKAGAAAFQIVGMCQVFASNQIPGNRNLNCVDPDFKQYSRLVWPRKSYQPSDQIKAGLITSLGFGHVSAVLALVNPAAFIAALPFEKRAKYLAEADQRRMQGEQRRLAGMYGGEPMYQKPKLTRDAAYLDAELAMLVSSAD